MKVCVELTPKAHSAVTENEKNVRGDEEELLRRGSSLNGSLEGVNSSGSRFCTGV